MVRKIVALAALLATASAGAAQARDQIRIVGSSTVFPFATVVAERFGKATGFPTPVVESTGSGGGLKLFCAGVGERYPDIANASRRIKRSEVALCRRNGVTEIVELKIGYDGIVLATSKTAPPLALSLRDVFLALTKRVPTGTGELRANPYTTWKEVNPALPALPIKVLGPPPTSGTRDAFVELAMEGGCLTFAWIKALRKTDKARYKRLCHTIREDGAFVEAGENDNLIVQKLIATPGTVGIFGFSYLDQNRDKIRGAAINGIAPAFENIADGSYPVSRSLYFYVKKAHVETIPGLRQYIAAFMSDRALGDDGYLADKGLIPMPREERRKWIAISRDLAPLSM